MEAKKLKLSSAHSTFSNKSTSERVKDTHTEEIVIGLCSQIGAQKKEVIAAIEKSFKSFNYIIKKIKFTDVIQEAIEENDQYKNKTLAFRKFKEKIDAGNKLREKYGSDYLANIAITQIAHQKKIKYNINSSKDFDKVESQRICYIIDSIKHTSELSTFRDVYQGVFYLISIYTPFNERVKKLSVPNITENEAKELIAIDQYEVSPNGQQVRKVFVDADFFVRIEDKTKNEIQKKINRYANLIFEYGIETPSIDERAMYEAKSASVNSACLSRQVGASILSKEGDLISTGWNDVPKYGGNLYTNNGEVDNRCFIKGICYNDYNKDKLRQFIEDEFQENINLDEIIGENDFTNEHINSIKKELKLYLGKVLKKSSIKSLIEFSRSVHAEMHAIINAGNLDGSKIKGGTLFCTTYPCHNCARHIIAAGIKKVYYIEPYLKSKAPELHNDSITEDETITKKVQILLFDGVAPRRYLSFFNNIRPRKELGKLAYKTEDKESLFPINSIPLKSLFVLETKASERIADKRNEGEDK